MRNFSRVALSPFVGLAWIIGGQLTGSSTVAESFKEPPHLTIHADNNAIIIRARRGAVTISGLGRVSNAAVYDIGEAGKKLPKLGKPTSLMPPLVAVDPGTTLNVHFQNDLAQPDATGRLLPAASNLHTHGLIVSPEGLGFEARSRKHALGDCVFVQSTPRATSSITSDPCADAPIGRSSAMPEAGGFIDYSYAIARDHPSGVFWIHPHTHMLSEGQVSNGLSALLTVGDLWDYAFLKCQITSSLSGPSNGQACRNQAAALDEERLEGRGDGTHSQNVKVLDLGLKDIQVERRKSGRLRMIEFPSRDGSQAFQDANDGRKALCGDPSDYVYNGIDAPLGLPTENVAPGRCWRKGAPEKQWLFTVSGQLYPHLEIEHGQIQVWRLANMSADVTYRLRLDTSGPVKKRLAFGILAIDGVSAGAAENDKAPLEIMLMPSARVEVVVQRCVSGRPDDHCIGADENATAVLGTAGVYTGNNPGIQHDGPGDWWPPASLAEVHFEGRKTGATSGSMPQLKSTAYRQSVAVQSVPAPEPGRPELTPAAAPMQAACPSQPQPWIKDAPGANAANNRVRLIRFNNNTFSVNNADVEAFGLHAVTFELCDIDTHKAITVQKLIDEGKGDAPARSLIASADLAETGYDAAQTNASLFGQFYPKFDMTMPAAVTAVYGSEKYWLLVNDSPECHNFHIHQMKFAVIDSDVAIDPANPGGSKDQCLGDRKLTPPIPTTNLEDNYPLPPGARVLVRIRFDGPKLGRFVFHCHILEHEDKGMMATIDVVAPK